MKGTNWGTIVAQREYFFMDANKGLSEEAGSSKQSRERDTAAEILWFVCDGDQAE